MWMDMALARQSGQELINHYIITNSPATAHIRRFFHASIRHLTASYQRIAAEQAFNDIRPSVCNQMRQELTNMVTVKEEFDPLVDEASGYSSSMVQDGVVRQSPVVVTPRRSSTKDKSRESPVVDPPRRSSTGGYGFPGGNILSTPTSTSDITLKLDQPIDLTVHILSPFYAREFNYQDCRFNSVAHLMCYRYAVLHGLKTFATAVRKWARPLTEFPTSRFQTVGWSSQCRSVLREIYSHLCLTDIAAKTALLESGPRPFSLSCLPPIRRSCFTQQQVPYLHFTTTRGTCTVRFLPSDTRTPISLETRCPLTVAWLIQKNWRSLVRWLWPEPQQTTSMSLFRTPLVVPMWMLTRRDIAVARRKLASMTQYVDLQDDHLAACEGGFDDGIPLMTVKMFPRPTGGIQSVLDVVNRWK